MDYREEFLQIWHQYVSRPGSIINKEKYHPL